MIPTFVIGLREGIEASLIVGIIAAFLARSGRQEALRPMWAGVMAAVALCAAGALGLVTLSRELPKRAQESLEAIVAGCAVVTVTFMIVWMNRHARGMKMALEGQVAEALTRGSTRALVMMAFLAVLREGFETAVFLLSVIGGSDEVTATAGGALIGIGAAIVVGYGIYKGGVRVNLSRFFRGTGLVLVLVAAGLLMSVAHSTCKAGWVSGGQGGAIDLSWLVRPGTLSASLLTGVLGLRARPTAIEVSAWTLYAIPMLLFIGWPRSVVRRAPSARTMGVERVKRAGGSGHEP